MLPRQSTGSIPQHQTSAIGPKDGNSEYQTYEDTTLQIPHHRRIHSERQGLYHKSDPP